MAYPSLQDRGLRLVISISSLLTFLFASVVFLQAKDVSKSFQVLGLNSFG